MSSPNRACNPFSRLGDQRKVPQGSVALPTTRILGIDFCSGSCSAVVERINQHGGLLVAPAAPALCALSRDRGYREALLAADIVLTDSSFMVLSWMILKNRKVPRISGLAYLRALLQNPSLRAPGQTIWVMANPESARRNVKFLSSRGISVPKSQVYVAPAYLEQKEDRRLLRKLELQPVRHVVLTLAGGVQEKLGLYLKRNLSYRPAIHCLGAAIAMLSGDQVYVPSWVDHAGLGWLLRCASDPSRFVPRYTAAFPLFGLMQRFGDHLPAFCDLQENPPSHCASPSESRGVQVSY